MRKVLCVIAMAGLTGCATTGPRFEMPQAEVQDSQSRLVLYHSGTGLEKLGKKALILLDGKPFCRVGVDEVMVAEIVPGNHVITADVAFTAGKSVLTIAAEAGKTTYISAAPNAHRIAVGLLAGPLAQLAVSDKETPRGGHLFIETVSAETAAQESAAMTTCTCQPAKG
jgi:hypothetical protein